MKENAKSKKLIVAVVGIIVLVGLIIGMLFIYNKSKDKPVEGSKSITIEVKSERDNYTFEKSYKTDDEFLGDFLEEQGLIEFEKSEYGRYLTAVQGYASSNEEQSWWSIAVDGESAMTGVDEIVLADGSVYTLELKIGW